MSESARKKQRTSAHASGTQDESEATLYADLHKLAGIIPKATPSRRATSAGPTPTSRRTPTIAVRTPGTAARTPRGGPTARPTSVRRAAPTTPHAIRALRERANAARTPGHVRRRSGRIQRETPRDMLRDLSRVLARSTQPMQPSPQAPTPRNPALELPDVEDGPDPVAPRLSMPLDNLYEDSFEEEPPRHSLHPDEMDTTTIHSLEFGRRAMSEDPRRMFGTRASDVQGLEIAGEDYEVEGTFIRRRPTMDPDQLLEQAIDDVLEDTMTGGIDGRDSDVNLGVFGEEDEPNEPTFRFTIPQRFQEARPTHPLDDVVEEEETEQGADLGAATTMEIGDWESIPDVDDDAVVQAYQEEVSAPDLSLLSEESAKQAAAAAATKPPRQRIERKEGKGGQKYSDLPVSTVKRLATSFAKTQFGKANLDKDAMKAIMKSTEWFFDQVGEDLAAYADHAGRKSVEEKDVITLMKRQRQITPNNNSFFLAQKMLPRELLQELRMEQPAKLVKPRQKRKRLEVIEEEEE